MPLPKELKAKLKGILKDGAELPEELDDLVVFPNEGAFLEAADKKVKTKLAAAEAKAADAKRAAEESASKLTETLKEMGIESADKIDEFKTKWAAANGTLTEYDKLKADHQKLLKEREKDGKTISELTGFKVNHQKRAALAPHMAKIHPDLRDELESAWLGQLTIDEKGEKITFPEGKEIGAFLDEKIKAKPSLKAPDFKGGAGTGQQADKGTGSGAGNGNAGGGNAGGGNGNGGSNGKPLSLGQAVAQALATEAAKAGAPSGP